MSITIRKMTPGDRTAWMAMRHALWADEKESDHLAQIEALLQDPKQSAYLAITEDGQALGFAEVSLRAFANGCREQPVPFLEGIWVSPAHRRQGIGRLLLNRLTADFRSQGFHEICSDADLENNCSHRAHEGWGFQETERVVYFRRKLN